MPGAGGVEHALVLDVHCGSGRRSGQPVHHHCSPERWMVEPHSGQTQESSCQRWPALNQVTCGGLMPPCGVGRRGGGPDHHRVVGVGHHPHVGVPDQRRAPELRHHGDLLGPVELVAGEVEQRDHVRLGRLQHLGEVVLVDLQHRVRGAAGLGQRRGVPGGHVGAEGVGGDPAEHADRGGGQPGGGGLAVGAGDERDGAPGRQVRQQVRVDLQPDPTADHRAVATAGGPGERRGGP